MTSAIDLSPAIIEVDDIDCRIAAYDWSFARTERARIDAHWDALVARNPSLFDGRILLAFQVDVAARCLRGRYFETNYRNFLAWRDFEFPDRNVANGFAMAALRSSDGAFMLGEMAATTANAGRLYFPAGTPEPRDADADGRIDFTANILRELQEETGLRVDEVELAPTWTLVFSGRPAIAAMRIVQVAETAVRLQERLARFNAGQAEAELARLVPVRSEADLDPERMPDFMMDYLRNALRQAR